MQIRGLATGTVGACCVGLLHLPTMGVTLEWHWSGPKLHNRCGWAGAALELVPAMVGRLGVVGPQGNYRVKHLC